MRPHHPTIPTRALAPDVAVGELDAHVIARAVRRLKARLVRCYNHAPPSAPVGAMGTKLTIGPAGTVTDVKITGIDPKVAACLERVLRGLKVPPPADGGIVQISYPFNVDPFPE